jgi:tetratricopeptide (TPR) repeat protein
VAIPSPLDSHGYQDEAYLAPAGLWRERASMGRKRKRDDKIIHVVFGPGGGRVQQSAKRASVLDQEQAGPRREPLTDLFTCSEISRLLGVKPSRLRTLDRSGVVSPTGRRRGRRAYTFSDLIALRTAQMLLDRRVRLRDVTRAVSKLKHALPKVTRPLQELRIVSDGQRLVVHTQDGAFEPLTGQMLLDLRVNSLRDDVVRVLRPSAGRERARTAYELYLRASQLDEDALTMDEAEGLYRKAIELDPWLAIAYTNLGNIRFRRHDPDGAKALYKKALDVDPRQPEAQYNLGYVMLECGQPEASIPLFRGAIEADPKFSDAYFNLAMAFEQVGSAQEARPYWKSYIALEPKGTWTEIAKRHL